MGWWLIIIGKGVIQFVVGITLALVTIMFFTWVGVHESSAYFFGGASMIVATEYVEYLQYKKERATRLKVHTIKFFYWWWNRGGTNTVEGYDEWLKKESIKNKKKDFSI